MRRAVLAIDVEMRADDAHRHVARVHDERWTPMARRDLAVDAAVVERHVHTRLVVALDARDRVRSDVEARLADLDVRRRVLRLDARHAAARERAVLGHVLRRTNLLPSERSDERSRRAGQDEPDGNGRSRRSWRIGRGPPREDRLSFEAVAQLVLDALPARLLERLDF